MECNVGESERTLRLIVGAAAVTLALAGPLGKTRRMVALGLGAMELITGLTRRCPVYKALGINTCQGSLVEGANRALDDARELAA